MTTESEKFYRQKAKDMIDNMTSVFELIRKAKKEGKEINVRAELDKFKDR